MGILNNYADDSQEYADKITKIGQDALYKSIQKTNIEQPKGEFDAAKFNLISRHPFNLIKYPPEGHLWSDIINNQKDLSRVLKGDINNSRWTLKQAEE